MASKSETGHAKVVANFEVLISFTAGYGAPYNPTKASIKLAALTAQLAAAATAMQGVKTAIGTFNSTTNAREAALKPIRPLATRIINALAATDAAPQTIDDAKSINRKIQGNRAKAIAKPAAPKGTAASESPKTSSVSQQSFDKVIDNFGLLITLLAAEPKYTPNEADLKTTALTTLLTDLKTKNTAASNATTTLSNARIARDKVLYGDTTGITDIAIAVKKYVKSVFGATSPQYRQVSGLRFV